MLDIPFLFVCVIITAFALFSFKWFSQHTETFFWTAFLLYFDPGGFFSGLSEMGLLSRLKSHDVFFVLMMLAWRASGYWKIITNDRLFKRYSWLIGIYTGYFVLVYGYFVPEHYGYENFALFFQKNRQFIYCPFMFPAVYQFTYMSINTLFKPLLYSSLAMFAAYFITVLGGLELLPIYRWSRFTEDDRISLLSYGLSYWILPLGIASLFLHTRLSDFYRRLTIYAAIFMLVIVILTLTRREFIRIIFMLLAIPAIAGYVAGIPVAGGYRRIMIFLLVPILILVLFFPVYIDLSAGIFGNLFAFLHPANSAATNDYRLSGEGDLMYVKQIIENHPLMGIGYYPAPWAEVLEMKESGNILGLALDASSEVPVFGSTMRLGVVGLLLPAIIHSSVVAVCLKMALGLKAGFSQFKSNVFDVLLVVTCMYYFLTLFTTDIFSLFLEYYHPPKFALFTSFLAILLGIYARHNFRLTKLKA